jgi:hypothetical protein
MACFSVLKNFLLQQTLLYEHTVLPRPCRDLRVGLVDRQHHSAIAQNVCLSVAYESVNLVNEKQARGKN